MIINAFTKQLIQQQWKVTKCYGKWQFHYMKMSRWKCINPWSDTFNLQQMAISNVAAFSKITNKTWYFMRIVCWQAILMKYHTLFFSENWESLDKQCRPRLDCFWRSSLIMVFPFCYSDKHLTLLKIRKAVPKFVICWSPYWHFEGFNSLNAEFLNGIIQLIWTKSFLVMSK